MKPILVFAIALIFSGYAQAQVYMQSGSSVYLQSGAELYVEGDINANAAVEGAGMVQFTGSLPHELNMHENRIANLSLNTDNQVLLGDDAVIESSLSLVKGVLKCRGGQLTLAANAIVSGGGEQSFIDASGTGSIRKQLNRDLSGYTIPIGSSNGFTPVSINASGSYSQAYIDLSSENTASPFAPVAGKDVLNHHWTIDRVGMKGELSVLAHYGEPSSVTGDESALVAGYWDGARWNLANGKVDCRSHTVYSVLPDGKTDLSAISVKAGFAGATGLVGIYPNPAVSVTNVKVYSISNEPLVISIVDAAGRTVRTQKFTPVKGLNQAPVRVSGLTKGQYLVRVAGNDLTKTLPLSVQ